MAGYVNQPSTSNAGARSRKTMLFVLANGRTQEMPCKLVLTEPDIESWDLILDIIARNLDFPTGIQYLYNVAGDAIRNPRSLQNANIYVAVPRNEEFVHLDYVKVFRSLLPMREVDLKRIDMSAELPQQVHDPVIVNVAQAGGYNIVGKSKSDGLATINNSGNYKNFFCHESKKRPSEISQAHVAPAPDTSKQIQAPTKPCGDVQDPSPSEAKAKRSTPNISDNGKIKEGMEHLTDLKNQLIEMSEFIQTWLLEVVYEAVSETDDEGADDAVNEDGLAANNDTRSDDGYLTSDEKDAIGDQYIREQETYEDFENCRKLCMLKLGEESSMSPETISTEISSDSSKNTDSDLLNSSDKADDVPFVDLEFDDNMLVRIGSNDLVISVTVDEPKSFDEESSTENSNTPVSSGSSSEKLDSNETPNNEMNNAMSDPKTHKIDHLFDEHSVGPCNIPNCSTNRVPQQLTVYQTSYGRGRTNSTTNEGQPAGTSNERRSMTNANRTSQRIQSKNGGPNSVNMDVNGKKYSVSCMENPKNAPRNSKTVLKCSNLINNGGKPVNNNKTIPPPKRDNFPRTSFQEGNRKVTKKSVVKENENRSIERNQKQCYPEDCLFGRKKFIDDEPVEENSPPVFQMPSKDTDKTIVINQDGAAYNNYVSNRYEPNTVQNQTTFCSPDDCPLKINVHEMPNIAEQSDGTNGVPRAASVVQSPQISIAVDEELLRKSSTVPTQIKLCSPEDCPLKSSEQQIPNVSEQIYAINEVPLAAPIVNSPLIGQNYGRNKSMAQASPKSNDLTIGKFNTTITPQNVLAAKTIEKREDDKCEEFCQPCPYKDGKNKGARRSKPQSISMPSKNEETKTKAARGSAPSVRDSKLASICVKNAHANNKSNDPSSSSPKNIPVKRGSLNDQKIPVPPAKASSSKTFKPQNQITTSKARSDQGKGQAGLCKTCPTKAVANSKNMSASPVRNPSVQIKRNTVTESPKPNMLSPARNPSVQLKRSSVTESPKPNMLKSKQVKVEPRKNKPCPTKVIGSRAEEHLPDPDEQDKKYCYPYNCKLKDKRVEKYCEPISCQDECDNKPVTQEPELYLKEVGTTYQGRTSVRESPIMAERKSEIQEFNSDQVEDNKNYGYRKICKDKKTEKSSEPISFQTVAMHAISNQELKNIAEHESEKIELNSETVEDNKEYCYRDTCHLQDRKTEKYCEPSSCQKDECQTTLNQESKTRIKNSTFTTSQYGTKNACQYECQAILNQESEVRIDNRKSATSQYGTIYQEGTNISEPSNTAANREHEDKVINSNQTEDSRKYCYRETCKLKDEKTEKFCDSASCQDECQNIGMQTSEIKSGSSDPTNLQYEPLKNKEIATGNSHPIISNTYEERNIQLPIQNMKCMPITCNDKNLSCLKEKEVMAYRKSEEKLVPFVENSGIEAEMLESVPTQLRRSIPQNEPVKSGRCTSKIKPVKQRLNIMPTQVPPHLKIQQKQEHKPFTAKTEISPIEPVAPISKNPDSPVKTKEYSIPQDESIFVQCTSKNKPAKQIQDGKHVQIPCPFETRQNQEIASEQDVNIPTVETGINPIQEVVPVTDSAVVQTDIVRENATQYQDKEEALENKTTKYCYLHTCQFKDRKKRNNMERRSTYPSEPLEFQADSGNETAEDDEEIPAVIRKCNDCIPSDESKDNRHHSQIDQHKERAKSYSKQHIESFEKNCYLNSCQVNNENAEDENDFPISKTKCNVCGVVKIVETRGVSATETGFIPVQEDEREKNENVRPDNGSFIIKESVQLARDGESPSNNEDQYENTDGELQPNWHYFSEELEEYCYSDFPDWRKNCCLTNDCPIHLFKRSFTRNDMPPTIDEVDEDIVLDENLRGSKSSLHESERSAESNLKPSDGEQLTNNERTPSEGGRKSTYNAANEQKSAIKGFHCPKCHVELLIIGDDSTNINVEEEAGPDGSIPVCETFLAKESFPDVPPTPDSEKLMQEECIEEEVYETPVATIEEDVPTVTETFRAKSLSKTNENNRIIFAPQIGEFVSEAESRAAASFENSPLRSTASIQEPYKEEPDERKEIEQTPSQFITDIIKSSKVVIDKFKLKPKGLASFGIKQPKCPDHIKQAGQQEPCCKCPDNCTSTNENKGHEHLEFDDFDLFIFAQLLDDETSRQIPLVGTKETRETSQAQPCVTTIEHLENYSRIYVPRFVTPVNYTQTYIETPLKEERQGSQQKNDSSKSSVSMSSPTSFSQAAKRKVSIKEDDMSQPIAIRYSIQEQPSPDFSESTSHQDSRRPSRDDQHPQENITGLLVSEPISLTTSTTTLHIVKGLVNRKTENCLSASLKEENQSKRLSGNTLESRTSRIAKCYCKEKTCVCKFECLGRRLNTIHGEVSAEGGLKKSTKFHRENGRKSGLSTPSIITPGSLSGLIIGENSSEYNGPGAIYSKSLTVSPMASNSEQKESLLQISPERQKQSFESLSSVPVASDNKNKKE